MTIFAQNLPSPEVLLALRRNIFSEGVPGEPGHRFNESWPDEGRVNMFALARALHDVGYEYMCAPTPRERTLSALAPLTVGPRAAQADAGPPARAPGQCRAASAGAA